MKTEKVKDSLCYLALKSDSLLSDVFVAVCGEIATSFLEVVCANIIII